MRAMSLPLNLPTATTESEEAILHRKQKKWMIALFFAPISDVLLGLFGVFIDGLSLVGALSTGTVIERLRVWLTVAAFPSFVLTAHCLDKLEAAQNYHK